MELERGCFTLDQKPFFLYSGEIHYFRVPRKEWGARLTALKKAGFNTVSTYIPWLWHEPTEGVFDFTGDTVAERDLVGFLDLAAKMKLFVSARVGPVSNAELVNEGLPVWLVKQYPEIFVTGHRSVGNLAHVTMVSYLHPVFQEKVGRWYGRLLPFVADRQWGRGGRVIAVQLCNEIGMVHWLQKGADLKDHVNRMYRTFLKEKYKTVEALNENHGTAHVRFEDVAQPAGTEVSPNQLTMFVDWSLFYRRYYATYFQTLAHRARAEGITVPLLCNIPQFYDYDIRGRGNWAPMTTSQYRDFSLFTPGTVFGGAYQMRHLDFENFHDVALTTEVTRMISAVDVASVAAPPLPADAGELAPPPSFTPRADSGVPVVCAELQTGIMRDRPRLYPAQVSLNVKSSTAQGLSGVNAYMFAGGKNSEGMGAFGTYHDWQAPIGPKGEERPHLAPLRDFGRFLKWAGPSLATTKKAMDTSLGFYLPYYGTEYWTGPWVDRLESERTNLWYDGTARLIQLAGYSYNYVDVQRCSLEVLSSVPSLWVYSLDAMDHDTQAKLAAYVKNGGKLFLGPRLPGRDLSGRVDTTLADGLGVSVAGEQTGNLFRDKDVDHWVQGPVQSYRATGHVFLKTPLGPTVVAVTAGKGRALLVGFGLPHVFDYFRDWVRSWGEEMGVRPLVVCEPWDVQAVLRRSKDLGFLFLFNYHFSQRMASVRLPMPGGTKTLRWPVQGSVVVPPLTGLVLPLNVPLGAGVALVWSTAEVLDVVSKASGVSLTVGGGTGQQTALAFKTAKKIKRVFVGSKRGSVSDRGGLSVVTFVALGEETDVRLGF